MRPIAEGLYTREPQPRLIGGRECSTGRIVFPCPSSSGYEPVALQREGTLWSYTVQRYRPKSPPYAGPEAFRPWAVGYVELPGEVIVESRITNVDFADIAIGMALAFRFSAALGYCGRQDAARAEASPVRWVVCWRGRRRRGEVVAGVAGRVCEAARAEESRALTSVPALEQVCERLFQ